jgi:hypothetical protein
MPTRAAEPLKECKLTDIHVEGISVRLVVVRGSYMKDICPVRDG